MWCCFLSLSLCGKAQISRNLFSAFRFSAKLYRLLSITGKVYEGWGKFSRPFPDVANDSRGAVYFIVHGALQFKYWAAFLDLIWIIGGNWNRFSFLTFVGIETLRFWAVSNLLLILHSELFLHSRGTFSNSRDLFSSLMKYSDKNSPKHNLMNPEGVVELIVIRVLLSVVGRVLKRALQLLSRPLMLFYYFFPLTNDNTMNFHLHVLYDSRRLFPMQCT